MVKEEMRHGEIPRSKEAYGASLRIALPAIVEMVSISLMGMIDTVMVGRLDSGGVAVSAVGITQQPRMIFLAVFFALNIAVTAIAARNKGAGDMRAVRNCLRTALLLNILLGVIVTIASVSLARPMMLLAGAQADTVTPAASYFRISSIAIIFQVMTMTICAAHRACGNTKITLKVNMIAKILSVALNFLLIEGRFGFPRLEVDGAAWSTVIAAFVAFVLAAVTVLQKDSPLRFFKKEEAIFDNAMFKNIARLASGGFLEQVGLRMGFFLYALVVAKLGTQEFAVHVIVMQLMGLSFTFADGIGIATSSLVGQNLGKKRPDLSIMYGRIGLRLAFFCALLLSMTCILIRFHFPLLFTDSPEIIETAAGIILMLAVIMPFQTAQLVMRGSLSGAGDTRFVALTMIITVGILRPLGGFILVYPLGLGLIGAWIAILIDQIVRMGMLHIRFARGKWINSS
ncbi:MAG: MATE family efflux transporter [Clostridiales bacterium]|jgi:putative MATE family efflux protein|nr:MATE family efflux transporter [Clostridiales bacterium]